MLCSLTVMFQATCEYLLLNMMPWFVCCLSQLSNHCFTAHKQIMKSEIMRINHEQQAMKEKIKVTLLLNFIFLSCYSSFRVKILLTTLQ